MTTRMTWIACVTFALCFLLAAAGSAIAQAAPDNDHFDCYYPGPQPLQTFSPGSLVLEDEYFFPSSGTNHTTETVTGLVLYQFCNPVRKTLDGTVTPIQFPANHLALYHFLTNNQPITPPPVPNIVVQNQFMPQQVLQLGPAVVLAVPSGKEEATPAGAVPPVPPIPTNLDHFNCFLAQGLPIGADVGLHDQFDFINFVSLNSEAKVGAPFLFCDAVQKDVCPATGCVVTSPPDLNAHLVCYHIAAAPTPAATFLPPGSGPARTVFINNQFVATPPLTLTLHQGAEDILCVPSTVVSQTPPAGS